MRSCRLDLSDSRRIRVIGIAGIAGIAVLFVLGIALLFFFDPAVSPIFPPCVFHLLTGLWCPGCGSGRALHALVHFDILGALDLNPLMVLSLPFLGYAASSRALLYLRGKGLPRILAPPFWAWLILIVIIVYWIIRNIPVFPFTVLAP